MVDESQISGGQCDALENVTSKSDRRVFEAQCCSLVVTGPWAAELFSLVPVFYLVIRGLLYLISRKGNDSSIVGM